MVIKGLSLTHWKSSSTHIFINPFFSCRELRFGLSMFLNTVNFISVAINQHIGGYVNLKIHTWLCWPNNMLFILISLTYFELTKKICTEIIRL